MLFSECFFLIEKRVCGASVSELTKERVESQNARLSFDFDEFFLSVLKYKHSHMLGIVVQKTHTQKYGNSLTKSYYVNVTLTEQEKNIQKC